MAKRQQPEWAPPKREGEDQDGSEPTLTLFNSLTRQKEVFVSQQDKRVKWYNCGPTVYDASHMGHARTYLTFDIVRRVIQNYFGYKIFYVMNITDIDDKIIKRARQNHPYEAYLAEKPPLDKVLTDCNAVLKNFATVVAETTDEDKRKMQERLFKTLTEAVSQVQAAFDKGSEAEINTAEENLLVKAKDLLSDWFDKEKGSTVTENSIFSKLPQYWEEQYHKDMEALNILPADCLTRVSEYVPEIVAESTTASNDSANGATEKKSLGSESSSGGKRESFSDSFGASYAAARSMGHGSGSLGTSVAGLSQLASKTNGRKGSSEREALIP